jgi:predicted CoA-binding protein
MKSPEREGTMTTKAAIEGLLSQQVLAVAGASRDRGKFGNSVYRELKARGYRVLAVNPNAETIEGDPCYPSLKALPEKVGGLVTVTQPAISEQMVREAAELGIRHVWLQQGSESPAAVQFCQEHGMNVVAGECILMYQPNTEFVHKFHRFFKEAFGGKPK